MDNDHNLIITPKGQYAYDADFDIYRRVPEARDLTHAEQFGWVYAVLILMVAAYGLTLA
jgi:hypothetical protein